MKRTVGQGVIVILLFILQNTIFSTFALNGVKPNLLLIVTVYFGFAASINNGMLTGFFCGLLCDIFFGSYIGIYSFLFMLLGGFSGVLAKVFYQDDIVFPYVTIMLSDAIFGFVYYILMFLLRGRFVFADYLNSVIIPELLYTLILSVICIPVLRKCHDYFIKLEIKKEQKESEDVSGII